MKCVNPRRLPNKSAHGVEDAFIKVSCGKCYACLANRRRGWLFRLENEHLDSLLSLFVTLTYDECNCDSILHKSDLQKFFKRLRHYEDFTYYAIGEYGTHTFRPHYHSVIFFKSISTDKSPLDYYTLISDLWPFGFVSVSSVTYRRLNYVLHYHVRPKYVNNRPTFQLFSKGLGIGFLDDNMIQYLVDTKSKTIKDFNGNTYVIPRYYRKKLVDMGYDIDSEFVMDLHEDSKVLQDVFHRPVWTLSPEVISRYLKDRIAQDKRRILKYNNQDKFI